MRLLVLVFILVNFGSRSFGQSIHGKEWTLAHIQNLKSGADELTVHAIKATLQLGIDSVYKGKFCNGYHGTFHLFASDSIRMGRAGSTKMYCSGGYSEMERTLLGLYPKAIRCFIEKENLVILTSNQYRLVFE